jgi:hypothetical protein
MMDITMIIIEVLHNLSIPYVPAILVIIIIHQIVSEVHTRNNK